MCGLTGVALHPSRRDQYPLARQLVTAGLLSIQKRGTHATGLAIIQDNGASALLKKAVPADVFVKSEPYRGFWKAQPASGMVALGHTRWATHDNSGVDDAAHPFILGKVTGAHNGMIYNWRDIEKDYAAKGERWINDSQAPFGLLNAIKSPSTALDKLDGYWALTWVKGKSLFMCRTSEAPLACAYLRDKQMLVWNSETRLLVQALREQGIDDAELWELSPGTIYRYDPRLFDKTGTHSEKTLANFTGRKLQRGWAGVNTARPPMQSNWPVVQRGIGAQSQGGRRGTTVSELEDLLMESLAAQEKLQTEVDFLFDVVREAGLLDDAEVETEVSERKRKRDEDRVRHDEALSGTPYAQEAPRKLLAPGEITAGNQAVMESWVIRCKLCGKGTEAGGLFKVSRTGWTWPGVYHQGCVVVDGVSLMPLPEK